MKVQEESISENFGETWKLFDILDCCQSCREMCRKVNQKPWLELLEVRPFSKTRFRKRFMYDTPKVPKPADLILVKILYIHREYNRL